MNENFPFNDPCEGGFVVTHTETLTHSISGSYPVHKLCPSIRWHMHIFRWSCYRWLRSDTSSAADSLLHKTLPGILGEKHTDKNRLVTPYLPVA